MSAIYLLPCAEHAGVADISARPVELRRNHTDALYQLIHSHGLRVALTTYAICRQLGASQGWSAGVARCAVHHDIGKLQVSARYLLQPGPLQVAQRADIRRHTFLGEAMLATLFTDCSPTASLLAGICRHHHERWDGSGYPDRLAGANIPLAARIVAVADVFDALTSDRPYRSKLDTGEAVASIMEQSGYHFDPDVVEAFEASVTAGNSTTLGFEFSKREQVEDRWLYRLAAAATPPSY